MGGVSDEELVGSFQQSGEMRHLDELVQRHVTKVRSMVYAMVLNHADADEVTQEIFIRMTSGVGAFRHRARFSTWLYRIAMNTAHSFLARRARRPLEHQAEPPDRPDRAPGPDGTLAAKESDAEVERAMADLSPSLRAAISLTAIQGLDVREAARAEGCLAATMYWRVHEARKRLKKRLARHLAGGEGT